MANTYTFTSVTGGSAKYKVNGGLSHMIKDSDWLDQLGPSIIRMQGHNGTYDMDTAVDTIVVNGTTVTGGASTMDTIFDALNPLFRKANSGNGGTGSPATTDASALTTGTLNDARLSANVAKNLTPTAIKTAAYTAAANELVKTDATSTTVPITLPTGQPDKTRIAVKMVAVSGTNTTTIATGGTDVFNKAGGVTSASLSILNQAVIFQYESTAGIWSALSSDVPLSQLDLRFATVSGAQTLSSKSIPSVLTPATDLTTIEAWGDSHTAGAGQTPWTTTLATLSGLTVNNNGVGGETSTQIKTRFDAASAGIKARPTIIWAGFNDYSGDNTFSAAKTNIAAMVAALGHASYLVVGDIMSNNGGFDAGATGWVNKMAFNRYLAATYGQHYVDAHNFFTSLYNPADATDLSDYFKDIEPNSTRIDAQHFTSAANALFGAELYRRVKDLGIGTTALNRTEIVNAALSPVNIGGVNKSAGTFSFVEADKINIKKDGGLYQDGLPLFRHFRRSLIIGNNSLLLQRTGTGTSTLDIVNVGDNNLSQATGNTLMVLGNNNGNNLTTGSNYFIVGNGIDAPNATATNGFNIMNVLFGGAANTSGTTLPTIGRIGIRASNLTSTLTLGGSFAAPITAKTAAYTIIETDYTVNVTGATTATITLPTAVGCSGRMYVVKNSGTGVVTVATTSSQTIDGATTYSLATQYKYIKVQSDNANWIIIGNN